MQLTTLHCNKFDYYMRAVGVLKIMLKVPILGVSVVLSMLWKDFCGGILGSRCRSDKVVTGTAFCTD